MKTVVQLDKGGSFLSDPLPERVHEIRFENGEMKSIGLLSVGTFIRVKDSLGLAIIPRKEVLFTIGTEDDPERARFSLSASLAKAVRDRLDEYIEACEQYKGGVSETQDQREGQSA